MFGAMIPFTTKADKIDKSNSHGIAMALPSNRCIAILMRVE